VKLGNMCCLNVVRCMLLKCMEYNFYMYKVNKRKCCVVKLLLSVVDICKCAQ
jgi:hypothetical protein